MHVARIAFVALLLVACRETNHEAPETPARTAEEQVARGARLYASSCAKCHGDAGEGSEDAPPLVGEGALPLEPRAGQERAVKFHTAADVAGFVVENMPPKASARAKLSADDYWAILGFALKANGVNLSEPAGPHNAASVVLHP